MEKVRTMLNEVTTSLRNKLKSIIEEFIDNKLQGDFNENHAFIIKLLYDDPSIDIEELEFFKQLEYHCMLHLSHMLKEELYKEIPTIIKEIYVSNNSYYARLEKTLLNVLGTINS